MKRIGMLLIICVLLAGVMTPGYAAAADKTSSTISVTGQAKIATTPNVASFSVGITTVGTSVDLARAENERIMGRVIDSLIAQGIDRKKITTSQFSLQPLYDNEGRASGQQSISGYRLQNNVTVVVEELQTLGTLIDSAFQAGANQFYGLRFGLKNDSNIKDELLRKAVQDGRRKAQIIADALGVTLGQPLSVTEAGNYTPMQADSNLMMKAATGTQIEAGSQTVSLEVNLVFGIF